ncbi:hypothetical protein B0A55_05522 [Friedmanniomyces simplex]|uniref:RING-type domain-containing protein n=1 Tax=Friedmanniomyces simplex TaxID=329884 RepID=A0A4U0XEP4_9PEZI|nr:hypothetical protein B0A55_05522 [Friedmanniomyces simplex]
MPAAASAYISFEDPESADAFCVKLRSCIAPESTLTCQAVVPRLPSWAAARRISCKKVKISWHRPTRIVWLNFGDRDAAQRARAMLNRGHYTIGGRQLSATGPDISGSRRSVLTWTVVLQNVPSSADESEVERSIWVKADKPRHIQLAPAAEPYVAETVSSLVESVLSRIGPVDLKLDPRDHEKRFKAIALFADDADARESVKTLRDQRQGFLQQGKLYLQLMSSSKLKVSARVYCCVQEELDAHPGEWQKAQVAFRTYPDPGPEKRFVTLKVEGEQVKEVANATNTIKGILAGQLVEAADKPFWVPALATNGPAFHKLKQIQQELGVLIVRNRAKRQLRLFGAPEFCLQAQEQIIKEISAHASSVHAIMLNGKQFGWACRGGFAQISSVLGSDVASFDVVSNPQKIVVPGPERLYRQAVELMERAEDQTFPGPREETNKDCTICWTPADTQVTVACQHLYCLECLESLCTLADSSGSDFAICSQGDMGACKKMLPLQELQDHLSSAALEESLEASFASYIRRRPQQFRYCPTPDCGYIYRTSELVD